MKNKSDKRVNQHVKKLNKLLKEDVFGYRFFIRQYRKARADNLNYYLYELIDNECSERNKVINEWLWEGDITCSNKLYIYVNNFIVTSDFWEKYWDKHPRQTRNGFVDTF